MSKTSIEWTNETWNPVVGCTRVSEGCRNCYAFAIHDMRHEAYNRGKNVPAQYAKPFTQIQLMPDRLAEPLSRKKPSMWFVNSMSDLFHKDVPFDFIDCVFATMYDAQWHKFQILTKRPERAAEYLNQPVIAKRIAQKVWAALHARSRHKAEIVSTRDIEQDLRDLWPLPNVWMGTSVEDQWSAEKRIPELLKIPAAVRFLSMEPLLGPVNLRLDECWIPEDHYELSDRLHWVIVGGESGPGARPMHPDWVREICGQCMAAEVPFFFKQWGEWLPGEIEDVHCCVCGCTEDNACDGGCHWIEDDEMRDRCSQCAGKTIPKDKPVHYQRVGRKAAGRLLDGREWSEFPELITS